MAWLPTKTGQSLARMTPPTVTPELSAYIQEALDKTFEHALDNAHLTHSYGALKARVSHAGHRRSARDFAS